jgi:hypothetical protein
MRIGPRLLCRALVAALASAACRSEAPPARAGGAEWTRAADSLHVTLRLANGRTLALVDDTTEGARYVRRSFEGPLPGTELLVVREGFYEGWDYLLVHPATGRATVVPERPVVSPDGSRLLVVSADLEAGYQPNVLQIWRIAPDGLEKEWELETADFTAGDGWAGSDPRWLGDTAAVVTTHRLRQGVPVPDSARARIVRRAGGWVVEAPAPAP